MTKTADDAVLPIDSSLPVNTGVIVNFTVSVTNNGPDTATDVVVNDEMPVLDDTNLGDLETSAIVLVSSDSDDGSYDPATGNYTVDSLASGETAEVAFTTVLVQVGNDPVENTATLVNSTPEDTDSSNNVGETNYQTLIGLITEQLAGPLEGDDALNTALDALGIPDLTEFLEDEILAGNLNLTELVDTLDNDNPVTAIIGLLEDFTGQDAPGVGPAQSSASSTSSDSGTTASEMGAGTSQTDTETNQSDGTTGTAAQNDTTVASSAIPFSEMAVGLMTLFGLFGSALLLRRD